MDPMHKENGDVITARCIAKINDKINELKANDPDFGKQEGINLIVSKIIYKEAKEKNDLKTMKEFSIYVRLHLQNFKLVGDKADVFKEPIFRAYGAIEGVDAIREMDDETYARMLEEMAEGAFLDETATPEEIEQARNTNKAGLRTYYDQMKKHYDMMEEKYGLEMPDISWVMLHLHDIIRDVAVTQVDGHLIQHEKEVLNPDNPEDLRLIHHVNYFRQFAVVITGTLLPYMVSDEDEDFTINMIKSELAKVKEDVDYLKSHPKTV
jgi:hypothetical protein